MTWSVTVGGPRLGTQVSTMTSQLRDFFGAPDDAGLLVQGIESDSAAEAAGVRVGDVIVEVDGQPIDRVADVRRALAEHGDGDEVAVVVVRRKKRKTLKATLSRASSATVVRSGDEPAIVREQVEQQLEQARQQLREAERRLEHLERSKRGASEAPQGEPPRGKKTRRLRRKSKSKSKSSAD